MTRKRRQTGCCRPGATNSTPSSSWLNDLKTTSPPEQGRWPTVSRRSPPWHLALSEEFPDPALSAASRSWQWPGPTSFSELRRDLQRTRPVVEKTTGPRPQPSRQTDRSVAEKQAQRELDRVECAESWEANRRRSGDPRQDPRKSATASLRIWPSAIVLRRRDGLAIHAPEAFSVYCRQNDSKDPSPSRRKAPSPSALRSASQRRRHPPRGQAGAAGMTRLTNWFGDHLGDWDVFLGPLPKDLQYRRSLARPTSIGW